MSYAFPGLTRRQARSLGITDITGPDDPVDVAGDAAMDPAYWAARDCYNQVHTCWGKWRSWVDGSCRDMTLAQPSDPAARINGMDNIPCANSDEFKNKYRYAYNAGCACRSGVIRAPRGSSYDPTFVMPCGNEYDDPWAGNTGYSPSYSTGGAAITDIPPGDTGTTGAQPDVQPSNPSTWVDQVLPGVFTPSTPVAPGQPASSSSVPSIGLGVAALLIGAGVYYLSEEDLCPTPSRVGSALDPRSTRMLGRPFRSTRRPTATMTTRGRGGFPTKPLKTSTP